MSLTALSLLLRHDTALQLLLVALPALIFLDALLGMGAACKERIFTFTYCTHFLAGDLQQYVMAVGSVALAMVSGVDPTVAATSEKGMLIALAAHVLTETLLKIEQLTGKSFVVWEPIFSLARSFAFRDNPVAGAIAGQAVAEMASDERGPLPQDLPAPVVDPQPVAFASAAAPVAAAEPVPAAA